MTPSKSFVHSARALTLFALAALSGSALAQVAAPRTLPELVGLEVDSRPQSFI